MTLKENIVPVVNNYHNTAAATTMGTTPANVTRATYQQATSPGPNGHTEIYSHSPPEHGYVQATSPQPNNGFQALAINRVGLSVKVSPEIPDLLPTQFVYHA